MGKEFFFINFEKNTKYFSRQPNQNEQPEWQSFFDVDDIDGSKITVRPYYELSNEYRTHESYGIDLKQRECQFLKQFYEYHDDE